MSTHSTEFAPLQPPPKDAALSTLWQLMEGHRLMYGGAILALAVATFFNFLAPLIGSATLDLALAADQTATAPVISHHLVNLLGGADYLRTHLWWGALAMAAFTACGGVGSFLKGRWAALAADGIARRQKNRLYDHLQHLPTRYHDRADTGDLVQRCTSDVETVRLCLAAQITEIGNAVILVATAIPLMLLLSPRMTALSFALIVPIVLFGFFYFQRVKAGFRKVDEAEGRVTSVVQENLHGIRVVRAFARQDFENRRFAGPNADYRDRSLHLLRLMAWYWSCSDLACLAQNGLVLIGGAWMVGHGQLTVGELFAFLAILNMVLWPVRMMGRILTDLGKTTVALGRLQDILDVREESEQTSISRVGHRSPDGVNRRTDGCPVTERGASQRTGPRVVAGRIEFQDVVFAHALAPDGTQNAMAASSPPTADGALAAPHALTGMSLTIEAGETLALLGPSGSGKSTLIHLLLRLYDCQGGDIRIDGRDVRCFARTHLRSQFGVVMQEPFLYSKTLRDNIRLGRSGANEGEIVDAAGIAAIHDTINSFEQGYDTLIGERGITLSGGQRQRVAIARAVLRNPPILVLDDAMSAVDSETESLIIDALRQRRGRRTTILIAHRLSTLAHADRVVVIEQGQVTQAGTHDKLVNQDGLYRRLWEIQTRLGSEVRKPEARDDPAGVATT